MQTEWTLVSTTIGLLTMPEPFRPGRELMRNLVPGMMVETDYLPSRHQRAFPAGYLTRGIVVDSDNSLRVEVQPPNDLSLGESWSSINVRTVSQRTGRKLRTTLRNGQRIILIDRCPTPGEQGIWSYSDWTVQTFLQLVPSQPTWIQGEVTPIIRREWDMYDAMARPENFVAHAWTYMIDNSPVRVPITGPGYYPGPSPIDE